MAIMNDDADMMFVSPQSTTADSADELAYGTSVGTSFGGTVDTAETSPANTLWPSDTGTLSEQSRRALVAVLRGPYLSGQRNPKLWAALRADEAAIRSRLNDLFLELVVDDNDEFAFVRKVDSPQIDPPSALRSMSLNFVDTLMLIVLRQMLLAASGEPRVIIGRDDVFDQLAVYNHGDEQTYRRSLNASWKRMSDTLHVLHLLEDGRAEISPVVKFIIDPNQVNALTEKYRRSAASGQDDRLDDERPLRQDDEQADGLDDRAEHPIQGEQHEHGAQGVLDGMEEHGTSA